MLRYKYTFCIDIIVLLQLSFISTSTIEFCRNTIMDEDSDHGDFGEWEEDEDENTEVQSLFCAAKLPSVTALLEHDLQNFGFDLCKCCSVLIRKPRDSNSFCSRRR